MNFKKTFKIYNEYADFKFQECCYDGIESIFREDEEILENEHLLSRLPLMEFVDNPLSLKDVKELNFQHDEAIDLTRLNWLLKIQEVFEIEYKQYLDDEVYFYGCSFKVYKKEYPARLKEFQDTYTDASEIDFINEEYVDVNIDNVNRKNNYSELPVHLSNEVYRNKIYSLTKQAEFLKERMSELGYEVFCYDDKTYSYVDNLTNTETKYSIVKKENTTQTNNINPVKWTGTQTELIELVKALIENESVKGKQKDIIEEFCNFFGIEIKNPDKLIQDIKKRSNGSETLFLDKLKTSLYNFIEKK